MMIIEKSGKKIIGIKGIVCILIISVCLLVSLIQSQKAYAETKKFSGTSKLAADLTRVTIRLSEKTPIGVRSGLYVLSSTDPAWNNASFFYVTVTIDPTGNYGEGEDYRTYGTITHPGGDQTFFESQGSWKWDKEGGLSAWSFESNGMFIGGTGKFEGIKAIWKLKGKGMTRTEITGEWEVEIF
jgi:hypothetical protein